MVWKVLLYNLFKLAFKVLRSSFPYLPLVFCVPHFSVHKSISTQSTLARTETTIRSETTLPLIYGLFKSIVSTNELVSNHFN